MTEVILHIGMGKTGSTAIQHALNTSVGSLAKQGTGYLGMWFDKIETRFWGVSGLNVFLKETPEEMAAHAHSFAGYIDSYVKETGHKRVIFSNEMLCENAEHFLPFVTSLRKLYDVRLVAYVRPVADWLPSAYEQWYLRHKTTPGRIRSFDEAAPELIERYRGILTWKEHCAEILTLRTYSPKIDIVNDFADTLGITLSVPDAEGKPHKQRRLPVDQVALRTMFNGRFDAPMHPARFNKAMGGLNLDHAPVLDALLQSSFNYDTAADVVEAHRATLDKIQNLCGVDLRGDRPKQSTPHDAALLRHRLLEHSMAITMDQADRLSALERKAQNLENQMQENGDPNAFSKAHTAGN